MKAMFINELQEPLKASIRLVAVDHRAATLRVERNADVIDIELTLNDLFRYTQAVLQSCGADGRSVALIVGAPESVEAMA